MKQLLLDKRKELQDSLVEIRKQFAALEEQIIMHQGALQFNDSLIARIESDEQKSTESSDGISQSSSSVEQIETIRQRILYGDDDNNLPIHLPTQKP